MNGMYSTLIYVGIVPQPPVRKYRGEELIVTCGPWKAEIAGATPASPTHFCTTLLWETRCILHIWFFVV